MTEIIVKVVDCSGKEVCNKKMLIDSRVNKVYNLCGLLYLHCVIKLLYNNKVVSPLHKISDILISTTTNTDLIIIFNIVLSLSYNLMHHTEIYEYNLQLMNELIVDTKGKIINNSSDKLLVKFKFMQQFINQNYNCLNIISICSSNFHFAILFEDGMLIIISYKTQNIINTLYNVIKIFKIYSSIIIIINEFPNYFSKLIISDRKGKIIGLEEKELNNLDYIDIYINDNVIFIINKTYIIIVRNTEEESNPLCILKYKINNITTLYSIIIYSNYNSGSYIIAAIKEDNSLISFKLFYDKFNKLLYIEQLEDINKQFLKIKKILFIKNEVFITLTNDNAIHIWGVNDKLIELYKKLQPQLLNIEDIVVSYHTIGILKKDNSIILISVRHISCHIYESFDSKYKFEQIMTSSYEIFALTDNNKVYLLQYNILIPIEIFNNIKKIYTNNSNIIAISHDNIVYAYNSIYKKIYYMQQINNLKSIKINKDNFVIIKSNEEIIIIDKNYIDLTLKDVVKFIEV